MDGILKIAQYFPTTVSEEDNILLMEEVSLNEVKELMGQFKYENWLGPDGLPIEFYTCLFDNLENDILFVIEESKFSGKIHVFNTTIIALIPKRILHNVLKTSY